jgi:hypothetical protein
LIGIAWAASAQTLRDIKGPISLSYRVNIILLLGLLVFLAAAVVVFIIVSGRRNKLAAAAVPPRPAHEIAFEQLEALKRKDLVRQGKIKEYYSEISDIIRHYLENRFLLKAPEMTTEEFLFYVRDYGRLISEHKMLLKEFLSACDLVKFAKYAPSDEEMEAIFVTAHNFVNQTKEESAQ